MGFGPQFISWVRLLYQAPSAKIRVNGMLSDAFTLHRGTRQGCPLSPLLFAIAIEPLACLLRSSADLTGFRIGSLEERVSLYADDMLLYLGDVSLSLAPAMAIIQQYGCWSGLLINWDKSVLMPLDPLPPGFPPESVPLQVVSEFKYLGVVINSRPKDYVALNLLPLLTRVSAKIDTWCKLPLSVVGRGNLIKMILMPQLLYILHNSPVWIPMYHFHRIHRAFRELLWKKKPARIRLDTLHRGKDDGGLAIPNMWLYFIASQLQHFTGWSREEGMGSVGKLFAHWSAWPLPCYLLEAGGSQEDRRKYPTLALLYRVWDRGKSLLDLAGCSKYTPFWHNPLLSELTKLQGFEPWVLKGVCTIAQLQRDGEFRSFDSLQEEYSLPHAWFYQYLQLRHAYLAQTRIANLSVIETFALDSILGFLNTKGVISEVYKSLLSQYLRSYPPPACQKWSEVLGPISEQQWGGVLDLTPKLSPSEAQRFSPLLLIHWVYRSPALLYRIGVRPDSCCPRCNLEGAHVLHMFWECTALGEFWREVLGIIHVVHHVRLPPDPKGCILGILDDLDEDSPVFLSISRMLFQARKLIAQHWLRPTPPTVREYTDRLNHTIRLEKGVYLKRRATQRFEAIWGPWLDAPGLPSQVLLRDRMFMFP